MVSEHVLLFIGLDRLKVKMATPNYSRYVEIYDDKFSDSSSDLNIDILSY